MVKYMLYPNIANLINLNKYLLYPNIANLINLNMSWMKAAVGCAFKHC